jgi:predicted metalloprotease
MACLINKCYQAKELLGSSTTLFSPRRPPAHHCARRATRNEEIALHDGSGGLTRGRAGGLGIGTIIILSLIGWALGINPLYLIGGAEMLSSLGGSQQQSQLAPDNGKTEAPSDQMGEFVSAVLGSTEVQWKEIFAQAGKTYEAPTLVMFSGATRSACGFAQSAMGPFYCPNDQKVYLDTSFFQDLERRFHGCDIGSKGCQFSQAYVITHEVGHHVQNLLGILPRVQQAQRGMDKVDANQLQVRVELQADCLAGVWAHHAEEKWRFIEPGDVEAAMQTASAIGDDRLQRQAQGYVVPDAFTHGSSEQRTRWFMTGLRSGRVANCDTFQGARI